MSGEDVGVEGEERVDKGREKREERREKRGGGEERGWIQIVIESNCGRKSERTRGRGGKGGKEG